MGYFNSRSNCGDKSAQGQQECSKVRVRASAPDPLAGLKGRDYIRARNLDQPVQRVQTSAQSDFPAQTCGAV